MRRCTSYNTMFQDKSVLELGACPRHRFFSELGCSPRCRSALCLVAGSAGNPALAGLSVAPGARNCLLRFSVISTCPLVQSILAINAIAFICATLPHNRKSFHYFSALKNRLCKVPPCGVFWLPDCPARFYGYVLHQLSSQVVNPERRCAGRKQEANFSGRKLINIDIVARGISGTRERIDGFIRMVFAVDKDIECQRILVSEIVGNEKFRVVHVDGIGCGGPIDGSAEGDSHVGRGL